MKRHCEAGYKFEGDQELLQRSPWGSLCDNLPELGQVMNEITEIASSNIFLMSATKI